MKERGTGTGEGQAPSSLVLPRGLARRGPADPSAVKPEAKVWQDQDLAPPLTLKFLRGQEVLFTSEGRWLHPLFELEAHLARTQEPPAGTLVVDRVTGRAAACLMARLGLPRLRTGVLSRLAIPILEAHDIACLAGQIVDRLPCATEDELAGVDDLEAAYRLLQERRARSLARND